MTQKYRGHFFLKLKLPWIYNRCCWQIWVLQFHVIITDVCEFWYDTEKMTANDFKSIMIKYYEEVNPSIKTFIITTRKDKLHNFWKQNKIFRLNNGVKSEIAVLFLNETDFKCIYIYLLLPNIKIIRSFLVIYWGRGKIWRCLQQLFRCKMFQFDFWTFLFTKTCDNMVMEHYTVDTYYVRFLPIVFCFKSMEIADKDTNKDKFYFEPKQA